MRRFLGALGERQFRLLFAGQAVSMVGDWMIPVALSFAVLDLGGSATELGLVLAAGYLPMACFLLVGGVAADRLPRQRVMLTADLVRAGAQATGAVLLVSGQARVWELAALWALHGTASAFFNPAFTGLVPQTVSLGRLQQANALRSIAETVGTLLGPAIAGVIVATAGAGWALATDGATFVVSAAFLAVLRPRPVAVGPRATFVGDLRYGWREFRSRTWLWAIVAEWALLHPVFVAPFLVLGPLVAKQSLSGASSWAAILSASGAGALVGGLVALRLRPRRPMLVASLMVSLEALPLALLAMRAPTAAIAAGGFLSGFGDGIFAPLWETALQERIPPEALSRVSAYDWMGSIALFPLGMAIAGPVGGVLGTGPTLGAAAVAVVVLTAATVAVPDVRRLRRLEAPAASS